MMSFKRCLIAAHRRFSTSCIASLEYKAVNEPIMGYEKGTKERIELDAKLKEYASKEHDVPIVIGDEEIRTSDVQYQVRPFDHQNKLAKFYYADKATLQKAIDTTQKVHREWESRPLEERVGIFIKAAELVTGKYRMDLMAATMLGQAKTIVQAEIDTACELADFYAFNAEWGLELLKWNPISTDISNNRMIYRSLEGFWAAVAPFNFTAIGGHLAGAPAMMGNTVLWKPSDTCVLSSYVCFKLLREAGVPAGVINFVPSDGPVFGNTVTSSPLLAGINFTGSAKTFQHLWTQVGQNIEKYKSFPRLIGECGGKNYHFVHPSGNSTSVVMGTVRSAFEYGGQKCSACSRMYLPESKYDEVKDQLVEVVKKLKLGSPLEPDSFLSAVIDDKAFARIKSYIDHGKSSSDVTLLAGGTCDDSQGFYVEPTIFEAHSPTNKLMTEEIFGPVLTIFKYKDDDWRSVLKMIDESTVYGLTGAIYAEDDAVIQEAHQALKFSAGNFYINERSTGSVVSQQPFGGARKSGTNDKAGGPHYLLKFASPQSIKATHVPATEWSYPYMEEK